MGLSVTEMIRFHHPCIVCRIPAGLCHKEGNHGEFWDPFPTMSEALSVARQLTREQWQLVLPFPPPLLVDGDWAAQGGGQQGGGHPAEKKGMWE